MSASRNSIPPWVTKAAFFIPMLVVGICVGYQATWNRSEPSLNAMKQLQQDTHRVFSLPKQEQPAALLAACERALEAAPELPEFVEKVDTPNAAGVAALLREVRDNPDRKALLDWLTIQIDSETLIRNSVQDYFDEDR